MHLITARTERLYLEKISDNYHPFHAVVSTWTEPFPGWIDDFNGPAGLLVGGGKGLVRTAFADPNTTTDYIPVDICIQFMLLAAWCMAVGR
jgi:fatty acyl-CoA reductase